MLLVAVVWVLAAGSAAAEQKAWTCAPNTAKGGEQFSDAHCTKAASGDAGFRHQEIFEETSITVSNQKTAVETTAAAPISLGSAVAGGFEGRWECSTLTGTGTLINGAKAVKGNLKLKFSGCVQTKPSGFGCVIQEGLIATNLLTFTTEGQSANNIKIATEAPENKLATINVEGCTFGGFNGKFPLTGSFIAPISGSTVKPEHTSVTSQETMHFTGGNRAGIEGPFTFTSEGGIPISFT